MYTLLTYWGQQAWRLQEDWPEAQRQFKVLLRQGSRLRAPIVTVNTIMTAYMKQGLYTQVTIQSHWHC